jgi:hypothetical protein
MKISDFVKKNAFFWNKKIVFWSDFADFDIIFENIVTSGSENASGNLKSSCENPCSKFELGLEKTCFKIWNRALNTFKIKIWRFRHLNIFPQSLPSKFYLNRMKVCSKNNWLFHIITFFHQSFVSHLVVYRKISSNFFFNLVLCSGFFHVCLRAGHPEALDTSRHRRRC